MCWAHSEYLSGLKEALQSFDFQKELRGGGVRRERGGIGSALRHAYYCLFFSESSPGLPVLGRAQEFTFLTSSKVRLEAALVCTNR